MTYRKKLIEVALPLEAINKASAREKSIRHGHPSTLHLWWSRKPLAAARAVIFASLIDDPDDPDATPEFVETCKRLPLGKNAAINDTPRQRLFDFIENLIQWENTTNEKVVEKARKLIRLCTGGEPPPLLDPFTGGGSIPLEAQRLGLEVHASDLNPIAVMINKALIEIPPKFANKPPVNPRDRINIGGMSTWKGASGLAADLRYYGDWIQEKAWEQIGYLYPKYNNETVIAWLWARTVKCPNPACGAQMPLVSKLDLCKRKGKYIWLEPKVNQITRKISFTVQHSSKGKANYKTVNRRGAVCLACETPVPLDHLRKEGRARRMNSALIAIVTKGQSGRCYYSANHEQTIIAANAKPSWLPDFPIPHNPRNFNTPNYGIRQFSDLFTPRQLVSLATFSDLIKDAQAQIQVDAKEAGLPDNGTQLNDYGIGASAYAESISVYLAYGIDRVANTLCTISRWSSTREQTVTAFARQALPMNWDYPEVNPFSGAAGDFVVSIEAIAKVLDKLKPDIRGIVNQKDAAQIHAKSGFMISTDPPYYDNISYAELSDFFYVWMRHNLNSIYPELFETLLTPKEKELVVKPHRYNGNNEIATKFFEDGLKSVFTKFREIISTEFPITIYYAFKQDEFNVNTESASTGWETILNSLINTGFCIVGTWPIRTERSARSLAIGTNALASSIVMVCRSRPDDAKITSRHDYLISLRQQLPIALQEMQSGNIAPVDLAQASIGPGMAVYSRYNKVLEPNGDRMTVRTALQLINHELDAYLAEQEGYIDEDSRFAVAWFEQFGFNEGPFGQADVLARAKNTSVEGMVGAGVLKSGAGKVQLIHWSMQDPGWDPKTDKRLTTWEATHHLIEQLNSHGEEGAARLLAKMPVGLAAEARQLAYRLYSICDRKSWTEHARDYNALVVSWGASQEQAREFRDQYQQGSMF